ncbi:hypothetical protein [Flavobacterium davisii]|uniref:hypothetical protein n=1 Tax=Flavobacterium davisii TaxID=2906077 RepID=UPI0013FE1C4C|nr:hypothetical protein [Flavobacterium davisii]
MTYCELRKRIEKVNQELRQQGYNWDAIELFWDEVIEQTKNKNGTKRTTHHLHHQE